jgi:hypothetical protein
LKASRGILVSPFNMMLSLHVPSLILQNETFFLYRKK